MDKDKIIEDIYLKNFSTIYETYKDAVKINHAIRLQDVKDYFNKREDRQVQYKKKGYNSFLSKRPLFELEVDIMDMGTTVEPMRYGMVAIDNFSKLGCVLPISNKQPDEVIRGLKEIPDKIGVPEQIYSDEEGSFNSPKFIRIINEHGIKLIQTSTHANTAERFIRYIKDNVHRRLNALRQDKNQWTEHINNIVNKYNNTEHNTIKIKPVDAVKDVNFFWVAWHLANEAKRNYRYPPLKTGDSVRANVKPKRGITKGHDPKYSKDVYKVLGISGNDYLLNHPTHHKVFLRHELLKV